MIGNGFTVDTNEECVALGSVTLYSNNQENCVHGDVSVPIGDELHLPCEDGEVGVRVMKCNETKEGAVFTDSKSYCAGKQRVGHALVRFMTVVTGVKCSSLYTTIDLIRSKVNDVLKVETVNPYYVYYRVDSEPFCYSEIYFELSTGTFTASRVYRSIMSHRKELAESIVKQLKKDVYVDVSQTVYYVGDSHMFIVILVTIFLAFIVFVFAGVLLLLLRRKREKNLNTLLLS